MKQNEYEVLVEIKEMLKVIMDEQQQLMKEVRALKEEQKKLGEEVRLNNIVLSNIHARNEILN